jgi:hypothetical protein
MELALTSDQAVIEGEKLDYVDNPKESVTDVQSVKKSELQSYIEVEVETLEALQAIENKIISEEEQLAYDTKFTELNKSKKE